MFVLRVFKVSVKKRDELERGGENPAPKFLCLLIFPLIAVSSTPNFPNGDLAIWAWVVRAENASAILG